MAEFRYTDVSGYPYDMGASTADLDRRLKERDQQDADYVRQMTDKMGEAWVANQRQRGTLDVPSMRQGGSNVRGDYSTGEPPRSFSDFVPEDVPMWGQGQGVLPYSAADNRPRPPQPGHIETAIRQMTPHDRNWMTRMTGGGQVEDQFGDILTATTLGAGPAVRAAGSAAGRIWPALQRMLGMKTPQRGADYATKYWLGQTKPPRSKPLAQGGQPDFSKINPPVQAGPTEEDVLMSYIRNLKTPTPDPEEELRFYLSQVGQGKVP